MKARLVYRQGLPLQVSSKTFELLNNGLLYLQGRDRNYRPILTINIKFMIENRNDPGLIVATYCIFLEYLKHYSMKPGIIENVVLIMNMGAFSF